MLRDIYNWLKRLPYNYFKSPQESSENMVPVSHSQASETMVPVFHSQALDTQSISGTTPDKDKRKSVTLDDDEAWDKFFKVQNDVSTNTTNARKARRLVCKNDDGVYQYTARDENKYNGKHIIGKITDKIKAEMLKSLGSDAVKSIALKESKDEDGIVIAAARIVLSDNVKPLNVTDLVGNPTCKRYGVDSMTFCLPDKKNTRGLRCRLDKDGRRIYEVANGSYDMTLTWYVEEKECKMKINVSDDGSVKLLERNGVADEQIRAHKEIKIGRQYEAKFLYEALEASKVEDFVTKSTEAKSALKELGSQLQQEGSEAVWASEQPSTGAKKPQDVCQTVRDFHGS